ncbi:unnamed protein product [Somion occarium]|uniref:Uncharacterized protein n=1 Tax=Somion occarium TaxID=3059160 RepID=A0ABP1E5Z5_9APHY
MICPPMSECIPHILHLLALTSAQPDTSPSTAEDVCCNPRREVCELENSTASTLIVFVAEAILRVAYAFCLVED